VLLLPPAPRKVAFAVFIVAFANILQAIGMTGIPIFVSLAPHAETMVRDLTVYQPMPAVLSGLLMPLGGGFIMSFGDTGKVMSGGRKQYTLAGYQSFYLIVQLSLTIVGAFLLYLSKATKDRQVARRDGDGQQGRATGPGGDGSCITQDAAAEQARQEKVRKLREEMAQIHSELRLLRDVRPDE